MSSQQNDKNAAISCSLFSLKFKPEIDWLHDSSSDSNGYWHGENPWKITNSVVLVDFSVRLEDCQMQSEVSWEHFEQIKIMKALLRDFWGLSC